MKKIKQQKKKERKKTNKLYETVEKIKTQITKMNKREIIPTSSLSFYREKYWWAVYRFTDFTDQIHSKSKGLF